MSPLETDRKTVARERPLGVPFVARFDIIPEEPDTDIGQYGNKEGAGSPSGQVGNSQADDTMNDTIEQLWRTYHDGLYGFVLSRVNNRDDADDILQDVFVKIQSGIGTLADNSKLKSWTYQITRNAIIDHYRKHKHFQALPDELAAPEGEASEQARQEIESCLLPLIRSLPDKYRRAVESSEIDGLTQQQVASELNISLSGAKSRVQRGRKMIKDMLSSCCRFEFDQRRTMVDYEAKEAGCEACR